jgi:hypothetical protein
MHQIAKPMMTPPNYFRFLSALRYVRSAALQWQLSEESRTGPTLPPS